MDRLFQRADGSYYRERDGSGPEHHDDLAVTPGTIEAKEAGGSQPEVSGAMFVPGHTTPGALGAAPMPDTHAYLVVYPTGQIAGGAAPGAQGWQQACEHAQVLGGMVLALPVAKDYRR